MFFYYYYNRILILAAIIPAIILLVKVYKMDKLEKEPIPLLIRLVFSGIISTVIAVVLERVGDAILSAYVPENTLFYNLIIYLGIVAFAEEGAKYFMLKKTTWKSREFNCQFDGVVYSTAIALGFALWENIGYVLSYGFTTAILRAVTAIPGHACFGIFMGVFYGFAKRFDLWNRPALSKLCRILCVLLPALLHGCYDFIASIPNPDTEWIFFVFVILLFIVSFRLVKKMSANDRYIS